MIEDEVRKKDYLNATTQRESILINDEYMRDIMISRIEDMVSMSQIDFCEKYGISDRSYRNWKHQAVTVYNIDPRLLYKKGHIRDLKAYMDDEKLNLPIREQISLPSSVDIIGNYVAERKTIQVRGDGTVERVWLKTKQMAEQHYEDVKRAIYDICKKKVKPLPVIKAPKLVDSNLLTFYPLPDLHWGMLICREEVNHDMNYDLKIAKDWIETSMKYLVDRSPNSKYCVIADLGDFLHSADDNNRTKHGNVLDVDQRHSKIVKVAFESMRRMIEEALRKHEEVYFYSVPGNHSEYASIYLKVFLSAWFKDNKRVKIVDTNKAQQYHIFGQNIIGFSHGHELKPEKSAEVMVFDNQEVFSNTRHRYFHFGHFHSYKSFNTPLVNIEVHSNLPPRDRWAESMGFRGEIGLSKSIVYHIDYGEISRFTFNLPFEQPDKVDR